MVVLNEIDSASPRTSGTTLLSETARKLSRPVWTLKVPGVSGDSTQVKVSSGETASLVAERMPVLSTLK